MSNSCIRNSDICDGTGRFPGRDTPALLCSIGFGHELRGGRAIEPGHQVIEWCHWRCALAAIGYEDGAIGGVHSLLSNAKMVPLEVCTRCYRMRRWCYWRCALAAIGHEETALVLIQTRATTNIVQVLFSCARFPSPPAGCCVFLQRAVKDLGQCWQIRWRKLLLGH